MNKALLIALLAAGLSIMLASAQPASASHRAIIIMPPTLAEGAAPLLTTGYHSTPDALDWDDSGTTGDKAYIRTFGIATSPSPINIALAVAIDDSEDNPCYTTLITFYEAGTWVVEGEIKWFHALPRWENINMVIHGDDDWDHYDEMHFSDTVTSDTCTFFGTHVHETFDSIDARNTDLYPTISTCDWPVVTTDCDNFTNDDIANWTMIAAW